MCCEEMLREEKLGAGDATIGARISPKVYAALAGQVLPHIEKENVGVRLLCNT